MEDQELIPMLEAARRLGVSKLTMRRIVRDHGLRLYANALDKREKLVEAREIERLRRPRLLPTDAETKKAAA